MNFIANQLVGLFDAHFRTSIHFTTDQLVGLLGAHHQPVGHIARRFGFIDSYAEDLPAMLETPRCLDSSCKSRQLSWALGFCYVSSLCFQAAPCYSDQGADLGQHIWVLIST